ncbi:MAG: hypothetical protein JO156_10025 [Solirubrobacterales bacterium]|nr:hypothetical protein [Solirubrobacterales bacterium]
MRRLATLLVGIALMVGMALLPSAALAGSSQCQAYNNELCSVNSNTASNNGTTASASPSEESTLPFTGLDVVLLAAGGGTLIGAGFVVRRMARRLN